MKRWNQHLGTIELPKNRWVCHQILRRQHYPLKALRRDNYRCVVTGSVDYAGFHSMDAAALQTYNLHQNPPPRAITNFCPIFPPSTSWGFNNPNDPAEKKASLFHLSSAFCHLTYYRKKYAGSVWAIINSFRSIDMLSQLNGDNIHSLENGFTMDVSLHGLFDDLHLWFEHIAVSGWFTACIECPLKSGRIIVTDW